MRFLQTFRLDGSDRRVFDPAAEPGEWAVSGAFAFADDDPDGLTGKRAQAFGSGFLGVGSFGRSTFAIVTEIDAAAHEQVVRALAAHFVERYGAPDLEAALPAARDEADFAASLAKHRVNTLITVERGFGPDGIVERFRAVDRAGGRAGGRDHAKIWEIVADDEA